MFAKLFKHEYLGTWRMLFTVAGVIFGVSLTLLIPAWLDVPFFGRLGSALSAAGFLSGAIVVPILLAIHYWRTMYAAQGYFTHSLPTRGRVIFAAKATYGCAVSLVVLVLGVALTAYAATVNSSLTIGQAWDAITAVLSPGRLWFLLAAMLIAACAQYVCFLGAITLGTRGRLNRLGRGGPVIGVVVANVVMEVVATVAILAFPLSIRMTGADLGSLTVQPMGLGFFFADQPPEVLGIGWFPTSILLAIVAAALAVRSIERHTCLL